MPYRVLIVDDHPAVRNGLRNLLATARQWTVCGEAADGLEAIEKAKVLRPDLVIMDVSMPKMSGVRAAQVIRQEVPKAKVLILSLNAPEVLSNQAAAAKADGFMSKSDAAANLLTLMDKIIAA